ncbi:thiamine transport system substrate-binding protein [Halohasta litchfieldiae]|jgi:thiamine transport system substrate-binding protein|uniref:Thiamine transport system substrate-binding protein n=1 Tax=Halohasta litchfieldiae TaxID=1073996 RepID=A0A1H6W2H7_9EURY|nr:thiamine ABC transporter substrate-binding protein [Halohasta litchfieldiae]ATW89508.1 thiamine transport system substrate-binding protein [Halohasta litchfieldiae]SEJ11138.1 thiamine transport system substrate-binding protein [Halohasta litchfieldiae]
MKRRTLLKRSGASVAGAAALTGCLGGSSSSGQTLTVATYSSFTGEDTAGNWLKSAFEDEQADTTVEFTTPESGVNEFIQRKSEGAPIDADLFVGLNTGELVRADEQLDDPLFASTTDQVQGVDTVKPELNFDPDNRVIPYDTGYISLVYDEGEVEEPATFDTLLEPEYEDGLITQNAQQSDPGRAFLLWTINEKGADGYLDYWSQLADNGVQIISSWGDAYEAYQNEEAPMVVSYSTDQVFYNGEGVDMSRHQVGFLNDQGYANPEGMAEFVDAENPELAREFMSFMLTNEAQSEIATRNVQFPSVEGVDPGGDFSEFALEPPEPVTFSYDELVGNVSGWIDDWARQIVSN